MTPLHVHNPKSRRVATLAGIALTICVAVLFFLPLPFWETLHGKLYDLTFNVRGPVSPPSDIALVAVDDDSLLRVGRWPWPRSTCAALIDRLSQQGAKIIALDIVFLPDPADRNVADTQVLKDAIGLAGNVVVPFYFGFGRAEENAAPPVDDAVAAQAFLLFDDPKKFADYPPPFASKLFAPPAEIAQSAKALGHINVMADPDGVVRRDPMIIRYGEAYYPSFSLQVMATASGLTRGDITVRVGESVRLGKTTIPTDTRGMTLVNYYGGSGAFRHISAADVLDGKVKDGFKDKIVFVGVTAAGLSAGVQDLMATPFSHRFPGVEKHAQEAASILQGRFIARPAWMSFIEFGLILAIGLLLSFLLPACRPVVRLMAAGGVLVGLGGLSVAAFYSGLWLRPLFPGALVVLLFGVSAVRPSRSAVEETAKEADETLALQRPGEPVDAAAGMMHEGEPLQKIGRYDILGELGQGAMGIVYQGRDPIINRPVAIKTILFDRLYEASEVQNMKARFFKEAQAAGRLLHPGIVTIFDVGDEGGLSFIAMEYLEGKDLAANTGADSLLPWRRACSIIIDAALALDFAHRQGIVHRDVKPANIMLTPTGQVKVMDFGIAKTASSTLTQAGAIMGTPAYMSPEQINGADVDGRSDLFSLGSVLYELLTGQKPFQGENIAAIWHQILHGSVVPASSLHPGLPSRLDDILDLALGKSPADRYQTGKQMADALQELINEHPGGNPPQPL